MAGFDGGFFPFQHGAEAGGDSGLPFRDQGWRMNMAQGVTGMKGILAGAMLLAFALWFAPAAMAGDTAAVPAPVAKPATAAVQPEAEDDTEVPDSEAHAVKAPDIDIARMRDPFESYLTVLANQSRNRIAAHRSKGSDRDPEPLEAFDLSALRLVATMQMGDKRMAMVQDPEGKGYVVRTGSYIGRDNGRVTSISERGVQIMEDEFTSAGDIVKRKVTLTLNEVNQ